MKAIILAAGEGTRMRPITNETPKPLIEVLGKSVIEYSLESIYKNTDEIIIIVKYLKNKIIEKYGDNFRGTKITYIEQGEKKGTAGALMNLNITEDVIILNGDSIFNDSSIQNLLNFEGFGVLAQKVDTPEKYGVFETNSEGFITQMIEKPQKYIGNMANIGFYKLGKDFFTYINETPLSIRDEYELDYALNKFANNFKVKLIEGSFLDIGKPEDIEIAERFLKSNLLKKPIFGEAIQLLKIGDYDFYLGLRKEWIVKIIEYSNDENDTSLQENTSDQKRFSSYENFYNWYNNEGRYVFALVQDNKIAGVWFSRPAKLPIIKEIINNEITKEVSNNEDNIHTGGIRIYPDFRGKGLAKYFLKYGGFFYRKIFSNVYNVIDIDKSNIPSQKSYEKAGYKLFAYGENQKTVEGQEEARLIYVERPEDFNENYYGKD